MRRRTAATFDTTSNNLQLPYLRRNRGHSRRLFKDPKTTSTFSLSRHRLKMEL